MNLSRLVQGLKDEVALLNVTNMEFQFDAILSYADSVPHPYFKRLFELAGFANGNFENLSDTEKVTLLKKIENVIRAETTIFMAYTDQSESVRLDLDIVPTFTIPEHEKPSLLNMCAKMRAIVFSIEELDSGTKKRILDRIHAIEVEINKDKGLFDIILGGVNDIGVAAGRFGENIKPLSDEIQKIVRAVRGRSSTYEQIAKDDDPLQLPKPDAEE